MTAPHDLADWLRSNGLHARPFNAEQIAVPAAALGDMGVASFRDASADPLRVPAAEAIGFALGQQGRAVVVTPAHRGFRVVSRGKSEVVDGNFILLDEDQWYGILRDNDEGLAVRLGHALEVVQLLNVARPVEPEFGLEPLEWLDEIFESDPWLYGEVHARISSFDPWQHIVAVGMFSHYRRLASTFSLERFLAGETIDPLQRERDWFAAQNAHDWVLNTAIDVASDLAADLASDGLDNLEGESLREAAVQRAELQGVTLLIAPSDRERLDAVLHAVDQAFERVETDERFDDEALCRAAISTPDAWWAKLFADADFE